VLTAPCPCMLARDPSQLRRGVLERLIHVYRR
jgi:hypothetical protein